jgi:hypothetical protein
MAESVSVRTQWIREIGDSKMEEKMKTKVKTKN